MVVMVVGMTVMIVVVRVVVVVMIPAASLDGRDARRVEIRFGGSVNIPQRHARLLSDFRTMFELGRKNRLVAVSKPEFPLDCAEHRLHGMWFSRAFGSPQQMPTNTECAGFLE